MKIKNLFPVKIVLIFLLFISCNSADEKGKQNVPPPEDGKKELLDLKIGMTVDEVFAITGAPTQIDSIGKDADGVVHVQWYFGDNQDISFENGKLKSIVLDEKKQDELFHHIMDSAAAADKLKNRNH